MKHDSEPPLARVEDIDRWLEALRTAFARSLSDGYDQWKRAREAGRIDPALHPVLAETALRALETMGEAETMGDAEPTSWGMIACAVLGEYGLDKAARRVKQDGIC